MGFLSAASHVPDFLDLRTWLPAMCALSHNSTSSCQQLARNLQMRAIARPRAMCVLTEDRKDAIVGKLPLFFGIRFGLIK
jgi:hypothetical protein